MIGIEKLDRYIFYTMCVFAFTTCINHIVANNVLAIGVLLAAARCYQKRPDFKIPQGYGRALGAFFAIAFLFIFFSPDMLKSAKEFWRYMNRMVPFFLVLFFVRDKKQLITIFFTFLISMFINHAYAIYKGAFLIYAGEQHMRVTGFESGEIIFAGYLLVALPILFILLFNKYDENKNIKKFTVVAFIVSFIALLENGTRIAWVIIAMILLMIFMMKTKNWRKLFLIFCVGILITGIAAYTMPFLQMRLYSFVDDKQVSNQGHYMIARDSLELIKDHPIMGVGLGRFKEVFNDQYRSEEHFNLEPGFTPHAHNNTLTIWAEIGIVGCISFWYMYLSFLYYSFRRWLKMRNDSDLMFFMITLATVLQGFTDYSFGLNQVVKIYFCMLAIYLNYQVYDEKQW